MRLRFKVIEVGWEVDFDDNRHPCIRIARRNWSAVLYDHPTEGWQIIALELARQTKRGTRIEEYDGAAAERQFQALNGGEPTLADSVLNTIVNDLYEFGRAGAAKRWVGKTITLRIDTVDQPTEAHWREGVL